MDEATFHDRFYEQESNRIFTSPVFRILQSSRVERLLEYSQVTKESRVLSLGCGTGDLERQTAPFVGEIVGVDISPVAIAKAAELATASAVGNVLFRAGDASDPSFCEGPFDAVWAVALLHHLAPGERDRLLKSVLAMLKPGGMMVSMDPSSSRAIGIFKRFVARSYNRFHSPDETELSPSEVASVYERSGYVDVHIHFTHFFLDAYAWLCPDTPTWALPPLKCMDHVLVAFPLTRTFSSEFFVAARRAPT